MDKQQQILPLHQWETLTDDFHFNQTSRQKWLDQYPVPSLLDISLASVLRRDFPLKFTVIIFVEENFLFLINEHYIADAMNSILECSRTLVQTPVDGSFITYPLKEQMLVSCTSIFVSANAVQTSRRQVEELVELLLSIINRPNQGADRHTRAVACECLRELERAYPCILAETAPHLWTLCQSERSHAFQSYLLLLTSVIHSIVRTRIQVPVIATSHPLIPFNIPDFLLSAAEYCGSGNSNKNLNFKELRRVVAFLLEQPQILTPIAMLEFMCMIMDIGSALELQASLLKVQFSGLLYSYDPVLTHVFLILYSRFSDALNGQDNDIAQRLVLKSKEYEQQLVFRLLALYWIIGFTLKKGTEAKTAVIQMKSAFYPTVFDPLALKAVKVDLLAYVENCIESSNLEKSPPRVVEQNVIPDLATFEDALVSVSSFKWLPQWSTETAVAFRVLHKFLIGALPHNRHDACLVKSILNSPKYCSLQNYLVKLALEFSRLVPVIVSFVNRLLDCCCHQRFGEDLLQRFDEQLLPNLSTDSHVAAYFPIIDKIAESKIIPPRGLLELLSAFVLTLVNDHSPDTGLKSWSHGSKVLGICRTVLMHHPSSRVFTRLSRLLAFICQFFPDLEVRDHARIYLRMLLSVPGKKMKDIFNYGEQLPCISPIPNLRSLYEADSHPGFGHIKKNDISCYIHLDRVKLLLDKQSWSLPMSLFGREGFLSDRSTIVHKSSIGREGEVGSSSDPQEFSGAEKILLQEPLCVMDAKVAKILGILRKYFSCIPDVQQMTGFKIQIPCILTFECENYHCICGVEKYAIDSLPALYAIVISYSSSAPYGFIPKCRIPFLLGKPSHLDKHLDQSVLDIMCVENTGKKGKGIEQGTEEDDFSQALVIIELEPREPLPGTISIAFEANAENGQIITGLLKSVTVGIEDMFLQAAIPIDIQKHSASQYYCDLFYALWDACGSPANSGREVFPLKEGKGAATISGTRSVKLLEGPAESLVQSVQQHLAPFIVYVTGQPLVNLMKDHGILNDILWNEEITEADLDYATSGEYLELSSSILKLEYINEVCEPQYNFNRAFFGCILVLIFLPPQYHLLFKMEVSDLSTLVRIRTDHWPCLAYVDGYLEALFLV